VVAKSLDGRIFYDWWELGQRGHRMEGIGGGILNWAAAVAHRPQTEGDSDGLDS